MKTIKYLTLALASFMASGYVQAQAMPRNPYYNSAFDAPTRADMNNFVPMKHKGGLIFVPTMASNANTDLKLGEITINYKTKASTGLVDASTDLYVTELIGVGNILDAEVYSSDKLNALLGILGVSAAPNVASGYIFVTSSMGKFAIDRQILTAKENENLRSVLRAFFETNILDVVDYKKITMVVSGTPVTFWTTQNKNSGKWGLFDPREAAASSQHRFFYQSVSDLAIAQVPPTNFLITTVNGKQGLLEVSLSSNNVLSVSEVLAPLYQEIVAIDFIPNKQPTDALLLKQNDQWGFWDYKAKELRNKQLPNGGICFTYVGAYTYNPGDTGPGVLVGTTADNKVYILGQHGVVK
jgi:hypothetical protein